MSLFEIVRFLQDNYSGMPGVPTSHETHGPEKQSAIPVTVMLACPNYKLIICVNKKARVGVCVAQNSPLYVLVLIKKNFCSERRTIYIIQEQFEAI